MFGLVKINYTQDPDNVLAERLGHAIQKIQRNHKSRNDHRWKSVEKGLKWIQVFVSFVPKWSDTDKVVGLKVGGVVVSIKEAFKTVEIDIETIIVKGDIEGVDALVKKIEVFKAGVREAYAFFSDHVYDQMACQALLLIPLKVWNSFCNLLGKALFVEFPDIVRALHQISRYRACITPNDTNAQQIAYNSKGKALFAEFPDIVHALHHFGDTYGEMTHKSHGGLASLIRGVTVCLARLQFLWHIDEMDGEDVMINISHLLQRIRPASPETLCLYMNDLSMYSDRSLDASLDIIVPYFGRESIGAHVKKRLRDLLQKHNLELMRSDIQNLLSAVASLHYSYLLDAQDYDELLQRLLRSILLLKVELHFKEYNDNLRDLYGRLTAVITFFDSASDVYSKKLASIFNRVIGVVRQGDSPSAHKQFQNTLPTQPNLYLDFKLMKIQAFLVEQVRCTPGLMVFIGDEFHALNEALEMLSKYVSLLPLKNHGDWKMINTYFDRLEAEGTPPSYFSKSDQVPRHFIDEMSNCLSSLLQMVHLMNSEIQNNSVQFQTSLVLTFPPMTQQGLGFLEVVSAKLSGLLAGHVDHMWDSLKKLTEAALKELNSLRSFLLFMEIGRKGNQDPELKNIRERYIRAIYEADYIIDHVLLVQCDWNHMMWLSRLVDEMKFLSSELTKFVQMENNFPQVHDFVQTSMKIKTQTTTTQPGEAVISLDDQENIIIDRLTAGKRREIVTISGMAGIGKTTLAKKVYDNPRIRNHFHKLAWCCVSQECRARELLLKILTDLCESNTDELDKKTYDELLDMLYKGLKGWRYLIVLDDVWGNQVWEEMGIAFSDDHIGSRVLLTTRNEEVGLNIDPHNAPHPLRFLSDVESWKLLQKTLFHEDECPSHLEEVGMEIAKGCKGLPLAINSIAGILKTTEKNAVFWKQIEKDLNSRILENPEVQCKQILELSYNHLPDDLKPCFLYFAVFGEDNVVPVQKLIQLWLAEGFVRKVDDQASLEDVAESYVMNLIGRSLVMAAKKGSSGRVKACKVHDMVYSLCLRKVEEQNFLLYIHGYEKLFPSFDGQLDYGVDSEHPPISISYYRHRLSICSKRKHFVTLKPSGPSVRTLVYSATSDTYPRCPYDEISFITENFKILSILDIESINVGSSLPKGIEFLYPLRYLAISGDIRSVPSTIAKLWNLETFIMKGLIGKVTLPDTLWSMSGLRYLHVRTQVVFSLKDGTLESSSQLNNMVSLSCPAISHGDNSEEVMKLFPKLRKLRCTFSESTKHSQEIIRFPVFNCLEELESLKIIYYGGAHHFCQLNGVSLPLNLKRLSLSFFRLTWDDFSAIGKLPNLNILKLVSVSFDSPIWEMKDDEFQQLEYLKLESLKIVEWNAESDHLPNLQQLVLRSCIRLKEVPCSFGEIPTLEMIDLKWCSVSAERSVVTILEQQLDYGNNGFKAIINGLLADPRSSIDD